MRYLELMAAGKPHLLTGIRSNLGAETRVSYAPSTRFYVADREAGHPWRTRLPFPVQLVERIDSVDRIGGGRFVTRYAYHHGYFDGAEREFRGFGCVEQWDTDELEALREAGPAPNVDEASYVPPVRTKTWFHLGAPVDGGRVSRQFEQDYWDDQGAAGGSPLPDTQLPTTVRLPNGNRMPVLLSSEEELEARRALKGSILRQETYADDGSAAAARPYLVSEHNYTLELRQPRGGNPHAVFHVHNREAVDAHYDRKLYDVSGQMRLDPRVKHAATLAVDPFGNVERTVEVSYGRRFDDPDPLLHDDDRKVQRRTIATCAINSFTALVDEDDAYRTPLPSEQRTYELLKVIPPPRAGGGTRRFTFTELDAKLAEAGDGSGDLPYEDIEGAGATGSRAYRRLIECLRFLYRRDDLTGPLNPGELQPLALPFRTYRLAFTPGLLSSVFKRPRPQGGAPEDLIGDRPAMLGDEGGYVLSDDLKASGELPASEPDGHWWLSSGRVFYSPAPTAAAAELAEAETHFFAGRRFEDAFGSTTKITWDGYDLLALESEDAVGNRARVGEREQSGAVTNGNDYRVLKPRVVSDANRNRSAVSFDALGMVAGTARMGKPEESLGDSVAGFDPDPSDAAAAAAFQSPLANGPALLGRASTRVLYDMSAYMRTRDDPQPAPPAVYTLSRETHDADVTAPAVSPVRHMFSYSDGLGREVQQKHQAEPDPAAGGGPRWVGTGWTVFDNKGQPVRHYEPFFTATHRYERDTGVGVSSTLLYDPVGRIVVTLHPNHTYEKVVFDPWRQVTWDASDTVTTDPALDADVGPMLRRIRQADRSPTWYAARSGGGRGAEELAAAEKAAEHANTPAVTQMDPLGRGFAAFSHNRFERAGATVDEHYANRVLFDVEGNRRRVIDPGGSDPRGRLVLRSDYDMLGHPIREASMDAGVHWMLSDVLAQPVYAWDGRGHRAHTTYDALRRPLETRVRAGSGAERTVTRTTYGESGVDPEAANMRGRTAEACDGAGLQVSVAFDFKGNLVESSRQLAEEYDGQLDWSVAVSLEQDVFTATTSYDALDRAVELTAPDSTVVHLGYNEAGLLDSLTANLRGAVPATTFVSDITYDARGQRRSIAYGNGARTDYEYDPQTFRLTRLTTTRGAGFPGDSPGGVQQIAYTYDPLGNVTRVEDGAQQTLFFRNRRVEPDSDYTYDALCRLIEAAGREHLGQAGATPAPPSPVGGTQVPHPGDGLAMGRYRERYAYDESGNLLEISHTSEDAATGGWTRTYDYDEQSLLEAGEKSNRLTRAETGAGGQPDLTYDESGNLTGMPHLALMGWDNRNQLVAVASQVVAAGTPETTHYAYDAGGQRVRKVVARQAAAGQHPTRAAERIYVGAFELYREYGADGTSITLERETLHVMDDRRRIALVETRTLGNDGSPQRQIRYQLGNLVDSATLELDEQARIVSYEEYHPYGSSSYQAVANATDAPKRYRYAGKERDSETGFQNGGRRYYAPWLGRWISCDPKGLVDGPNLYAYVGCNPISRVDAAGTDQTDAKLMWEYAKSLVTDPKELYSYTPMGWSLTDWKNSGLALAGYAKGVAEVVAAPGVLTYYATGSLIYRTNPKFFSQYKEQDAKFQEIASGLKKATSSGGAAVDFVVDGFTGGLDRMNKALQKGDPFEAGAGAGNFTASLAMVAEGGKGGKFSVSWEPSTQSVATMGLSFAFTAPPNALPAAATLMASSANQAAYKKSSGGGGGGGFGGAPIVSGKAATKVAKLSAAARAELALIKEKVIDLAAWGIGIADAEGIPRTAGRAGTNAHATLEAFVADLNAELAKKGSKFRLVAEQFYDAKGNVTGRRAAGSVGVDIRVEYAGKLTDVAWDLKTGRIGQTMLDEIGKLIDAVVEPLGPRAPNPPAPPVTVPP